MPHPTSPDVRKNLWISPPRAYGAAGPVGQVIVCQTTTTAAYLELDSTTFGLSYNYDSPMNAQGTNAPAGSPQGLMGCCVTIYAETTDLGVVFGQTAAEVNGSSISPALATYGSVAAGVYTAVAQTCWRIPAGTSQRFLTQIGVDKFLGWVAAGNGLIRIYQSSAFGLDG